LKGRKTEKKIYLKNILNNPTKMKITPLKLLKKSHSIATVRSSAYGVSSKFLRSWLLPPGTLTWSIIMVAKCKCFVNSIVTQVYSASML